MAIIQSGGAAGTALLIDPTFAAARVAMRPVDTLGWNSVGAATGNVSALVINNTVFSLRNFASNPIIVRRVGVGFITTTAFTAPQQISFGLLVARSFTASDSGGTAIAFTGQQLQAPDVFGHANVDRLRDRKHDRADVGNARCRC